MVLPVLFIFFVSFFPSASTEGSLLVAVLHAEVYF